MSGRDRTREILDVKQRDARRIRFGSFALESLRCEWDKSHESPACQPDFYLIRAVTLLEVFTRRNLAELIDDDDRRFIDRAVEFAKHVKIDFALVRDIQGRTITLGDVLAHSVPINSFGQILSSFETLLGKPLRPLLETAVERWSVEVMKQPAEPIIPNFDELARAVGRLFDVRHILCHEVPGAPIYATDEVAGFLDGSIRLVKALYEVLMFERYGRVPLTQTEMNISAREDLKMVEETMAGLLSKIEARLGEADKQLATLPGAGTDTWLGVFRESQERWLLYRKAQCEFKTYINRGGSIRPLNWANLANYLTRLRIADLEVWLKEDSKR